MKPNLFDLGEFEVFVEGGVPIVERDDQALFAI